MSIYIIVNDSTGIIVNRIVLDDPAMWEAPAGHSMVEETSAPMAIGGSYVNGIYTPPVLPPPPEPPPPAPPTPEQEILYDHENRIRAQEGQPPLELGEFVNKLKP